jgi:hypothetical protein
MLPTIGSVKVGRFDNILCNAISKSIEMAGKHSLTFRIETNLQKQKPFRWTILEGDLVKMTSPQAYATQKEAEAEAGKAMMKLLIAPM